MLKKLNKNNEKEDDVTMDYRPFFKKLEEKGISQYRLKEDYEISSATLQRMRRGQNMTLATACTLMKIVDVDDINNFVNIIFKKNK